MAAIFSCRASPARGAGLSSAYLSRARSATTMPVQGKRFRAWSRQKRLERVRKKASCSGWGIIFRSIIGPRWASQAHRHRLQFPAFQIEHHKRLRPGAMQRPGVDNQRRPGAVLLRMVRVAVEQKIEMAAVLDFLQ